MNDEQGSYLETEAHLQWALRQLNLMETGLASLRLELHEQNPPLLAATAPAYERRIAQLQQEIASFLYRNPPAVSVVARNNFGTARNVAATSLHSEELVTA